MNGCRVGAERVNLLIRGRRKTARESRGGMAESCCADDSMQLLYDMVDANSRNNAIVSACPYI